MKRNEGKIKKMKKSEKKTNKNLGRAGQHRRPDRPGKILGPEKIKNLGRAGQHRRPGSRQPVTWAPEKN